MVEPQPAAQGAQAYRTPITTSPQITAAAVGVVALQRRVLAVLAVEAQAALESVQVQLERLTRAADQVVPDKMPRRLTLVVLE